MNHRSCNCANCQELRRDANRYRWLKDNMTFYNSAESTGPVLASVSRRIWYHATDSIAWPLDAVIDAGRGLAVDGEVAK